MTSQEIRKAFLDFFAKKEHKIQASAPMVIKNDPTLMFTNAGMNQFKDIFLEHRQPTHKRIANAQKCLRVSGKHNDLEEVGKDTYHHTMFEMLGNWSFGDYFKETAIKLGYEFLTNIMKLDENRLYATIFEGNKTDKLEPDNEAKKIWTKYLPPEKIILGNKKDNFWEMGTTGPCGPCSEIHIDLRPKKDREKIPGQKLINKNHPLVIEIWNLVFIQYNRKQNGNLVLLPKKHVDTGMGFERLCMAVQGKTSNYDTDLFQPMITKISEITKIKYGENEKTDIAIRVIADHIRTITFSVADGQIPSNEKAGYVIRRILRRAIRYSFSFLNIKKPFIYKIVPTLIKIMGEQYPEITKQQDLIMKIIKEEEISFLKTLETGINLLNDAIHILKAEKETILDGKLAFTLYDSYGFPPDLTELILAEKGYTMNKNDFNKHMQERKNSSRNNIKQTTEQWTTILNDDIEEFVGYDRTNAKIKITKYRKAKIKNENIYHLVFNITPFYPQSGGQIGDTGYIKNENEKIQITDTQKEHNLIIHYTQKLPKNINTEFHATVNAEKQKLTACNHSATHLLHNALRKILGKHVEQKGSLVDNKKLRFDFAHHSKLTPEQIAKIETTVNENIRQNIPLSEYRNIPITEAQEMGAMALFGEKYGDTVRVIQFGKSIELCGGIHVKGTGEIGLFKIMSETAIAAGIRRIEAITAVETEKYLNELENTINEIKKITKTPTKITDKIKKLTEDEKETKKQIKILINEKIKYIKSDLKNKIVKINEINVITQKLNAPDTDFIKQISFELKNEIKNLFLAIGAKINNKAFISIIISENIINKEINANNIIRKIAKEVNGGGGGQDFYATAGGKTPENIDKALKKCTEEIKKYI